MVRHCSAEVLDSRKKEFQRDRFMDLFPRLRIEIVKSKIANVVLASYDSSPLSLSTFGGIVRPICFAASD